MITPELISTGIDTGAVSIVDSPNGDGAVCQIGAHWFYFGGAEAEGMTAAEYLTYVPKEDIVDEILGVLDSSRYSPEFEDEYRYYEAFLKEVGHEENQP